MRRKVSMSPVADSQDPVMIGRDEIFPGSLHAFPMRDGRQMALQLLAATGDKIQELAGVVGEKQLLLVTPPQ
jgi:hypothetical protein